MKAQRFPMILDTCHECGALLDESGRCPAERRTARYISLFFSAVAIAIIGIGWWLS